MSSSLVSLCWIDGSAVRIWRAPQKHSLCAPRLRNGLCNVGPSRLVAEARAQMVQQGCNLVVVHAGSEARHDRAAFSVYGANAGQYDVGEIARIGASDSGAKAEIDPAIGQGPIGLMACRAGRGVDRCAGRVGLRSLR